MNPFPTERPTLHLHLPKNATEYVDLVEKFSALVDQELCNLETNQRDGRYARDIALRMPAIISAVNVISYLRGQDGMFLNYRPQDLSSTGLSSAFYGNEDAFEHRLQGLIDYLGTTEENAFYRETLERYYITARTSRGTA